MESNVIQVTVILFPYLFDSYYYFKVCGNESEGKHFKNQTQ